MPAIKVARPHPMQCALATSHSKKQFLAKDIESKFNQGHMWGDEEAERKACE
jgi:hypothetical protein